MKKILPLLLTIIMIFSTNIMIYGAEDEPSDWAKEDVMETIDLGYIPEHLQNNYQQPITREEFAEIMVTAIFTARQESIDSAHFDTKSGWDFQKLTPENFLSKVTTTEYFTDTDNPYIRVANILGIINGDGNHKFHPDELITREQAAVMFMNYFHSLDNGNRKNAVEELSDLDEASSWAREAVICAYGRCYIKGIKNPVFFDNSWEVMEKGYFDTKSNLSREQAITIILRISEKHILNDLLLRGYIRLTMDDLMSGFEIDGNTVKMKRSGFDSKYTLGMKYLRSRDLENYINQYTSQELDVLSVLPLGTDSLNNIYTIEKMDRILSGKEITYDYEIFTITYNKSGYLAVFEKNDYYGYWAGTGFSIHYYSNGKWHLLECKSIK
ncbi:S-layer homology domain-containing protein [Vallitalea guaymasensis]|uniref:S-layer homology domain-containing protein n=1 Tax=Vallitalea guaymasensis TaxID=1185412 RepID=UPI002357A269|nr:S-layer homology domain-containing protein [Vallitalea guaymasensis]